MFYLPLFPPPPRASPQKALAGQQARQYSHYSQPLFGLSSGEELQFPVSAGTQFGITNRKKGRFGFLAAMKLDLERKSSWLQRVLHCFLALKPPVPTQSPMSWSSSVVVADALPPLSFLQEFLLQHRRPSVLGHNAGLCHPGIEGEVVDSWGLWGDGWEAWRVPRLQWNE